MRSKLRETQTLLLIPITIMCISHHVLSFWRTYKCVSQQRIRRTWSCPKYVSHKALIRPLHARFDALAWFFSRIATFVLVLEVSDDKKITHPFLGSRSSRYLSLCDWVPFVLTDSNSRRRHIRGALGQFIEWFWFVNISCYEHQSFFYWLFASGT